MMWMADGFLVGMAAYVKNRRTAIRQKESHCRQTEYSLLIESDCIRPAGRFAFRLAADLIIQPRLPLVGPISGLWLRLIVLMS